VGVPYVIENVPGAPLLKPCILCGSMFGLDIQRHRLFEANFSLFAPAHPKCRGIAKAAAARRGWEYRDMSVTGKGRRQGTSERWSELLGIDWPMRQHDLKESIPPAYTEWVGLQLFMEIA
jgi:DNA (cytosine-5)-methyltransferase 1